MEGLFGQPLYEEGCRVDEMYQRFNEAYGKVKTVKHLKKNNNV